MKVAFLLGSLNRGGTETLLLDVFQNISCAKFEALGVYRKTGVLESDFLSTEVKMIKLRTQVNIFLYLRKLRLLMVDQDIDVVHAQQFIDALYALFACVGTKKKIVLSVHGFDFNFSKISLFLNWVILKLSHTNIFVSEMQCNYFIKKYKLNPRKQMVVYNGISFKKMYDNEFSDIREKLKLTSGELLLGTVGNFVPGRNPLFICQFLNKLHQNGFNFKFIFIGKKSETTPEIYDSCVNYVQKNNLNEKVFFLGSRNDVYALLKELDAFVYASDHDTFGIAVVEALASGIPVFVNDWGVMNEITSNGEYATLYKTGDVNDLSDKFSVFLMCVDDYTIKANRASDCVKKKYSIGSHIDSLMRVYDNI